MYNCAIIRKPGLNFSEGITTSQLGKPDFEKALLQHQTYAQALQTLGIQLIELEADIDFPDGCFVEDPAVVTDEIAVITNPGASSRKGEIQSIIPALEKFRKLSFIESPGTVDGGDVMQTEDRFYIGISGRTNEEGAKQLKDILSVLGYDCSLIPVKSALHLKSVVSYIGNNTLLTSAELSKQKEFQKFNAIVVPEKNIYAANCMFLNDILIMPMGFDSLKEKLSKMNYKIIELEMSEFEKMDGGLTCLSLRFRR